MFLTSKKDSEKTLEPRLVNRVKMAGGLALKFLTPGFTGVPDRIVLMPGGRLSFVELKSEDKTTGKRQKIVIPLLIRLGFRVWFIDREETLQLFFNELGI